MPGRDLVLRCLALTLCLAILFGCGCKSEENRRVELLQNDPHASFKASCNEFLAGVAEQSDWKTTGAPETKVGTASEETAGDLYSEEAYLGFLTVTLADKDKKETTFQFVFVSIPAYGTWELHKVGAMDPVTNEFAPYEGDIEKFRTISHELGKYKP